MPESSDEFRSRLQASGKWTEFKAYRVALENHGRSSRDAWIEAAKAFGFTGECSISPGGKNKPKVTLMQSAPSEVFDGKSSNVRGDFAWVYKNLGVSDITADQSPSSGAWGLLEFARSEPREFYKSWMAMVSRQVDRDDVMEGFREDATRSTNEIAEMLRSLESAVIRSGPEDDEGESAVPDGGVEESGGGSGISEGSVAGMQS